MFAVVVALLMVACGGTVAAPAAVPSTQGRVTFGTFDQVDGTRSYRVFDPGDARAIVLLLHGYGSSGAEFARITGFDAEASRDHLLAVYPDGGQHAWNAGFCCPFAAPPPRDDVAYLLGLVAAVGKPGWKVFVAGFSNGGMMAYRLACQVPERITAIAVDGADGEECSPKPPLPAILHVQGTADNLTGNRVWGLRGGHWVNTEPSATARWQRLGATVQLVSVPGGDHRWYRDNPDATRLAGEFFVNRL